MRPAVLEPGREDTALGGGITVSPNVNDHEQAIRLALDCASEDTCFLARKVWRLRVVLVGLRRQ